MDAEAKLELIKEALRDCRDGKFSDLSFVIIVGMLVDPCEITPDDIAWAHQVIARIAIPGGDNHDIEVWLDGVKTEVVAEIDWEISTYEPDGNHGGEMMQESRVEKACVDEDLILEKFIEEYGPPYEGVRIEYEAYKIGWQDALAP